MVRPGRPALSYRIEGNGPALVLIHGVGGDSASWDAVVRQLAPRRRLVLPDLSGHGKSEPLRSPIGIEDFARDVTDVMDHAGVAACGIAGFSLGGTVALSLALHAPRRVTKIALVSTVLGRTDAERTGALARIQVIKDKGLAPIAEANRERWFTDEFRKRHPELVAARVRTLMSSDVESYLHAFTVFATVELAPRLAEVRVPTLVLTGEHDVAATPRMARLMHERIAGSELHILPGLRHSLLIEAPDRVAPLLDRFFP